MLSKLAGHARANLVAYVALFVALSGTAYAAPKFTGDDIVDESLTGADIRNGSLVAGDLGVAAAFGSGSSSEPWPHVESVQSSTTVTVARPSTLLVFGQSDGLAICQTPAPGQNVCQVAVALYLDGNPIRASRGRSDGLFPDEALFFDETSMFGIVRDVAPGTHTVSVGVGTRDGDDVLTASLDERVAAIAIPD